MRLTWLVALSTVLSAVALSGCSGSSDSDSLQKIDELAAQVTALEAESEASFAGSQKMVEENLETIERLTAEIDILKKVIVIGENGLASFATPTPVAIEDYNDYGFGLPVPSNVTVTSAGLTTAEASNESGSLLAAAGGTSLFLVWNSAQPPLTSEESVIGAFEMLQSLTGAEFEAAGAGAGLTVDNQPGSFGTFLTRDESGVVAGYGIIGGWVCPNDERSYAMTVTGQSLEPVQQSFVYLTNGFRCEAGTEQPAPAAQP